MANMNSQISTRILLQYLIRPLICANKSAHLFRSAFAARFCVAPLAGRIVLGRIVERPTHRVFIRAASSKDLMQRLGLQVGALLCRGGAFAARPD